MTHNTHILVVDDDSDLRASLAEVLRDEGYEVSCATDGEEALRALRASAPDVILLDLTMPVMDGWTFRERQLEDPRLASIPTVVISASHSDAISVGALGAAAYLPKPFEAAHLTETLRRLCAARSPPAQHALAAQPPGARGARAAGARRRP